MIARASKWKVLPACLLGLALTAPAIAQETQIAETNPLSYADIADMISVAPVVAVAKTGRAKRLKGDLAVNLTPGYARYLVEAKLSALLRGDQGMPARITYLADVPLDPSNRQSKLAKQQVLLALAPVPGRPEFVQLISARAQIPWSAAQETRIRELLRELVAPDAPPRVTGIGNAFHVRGSLPGESETQIFLKTEDGQPISLAILRRPGEETRWAVALGEMVDEAARPPQPDTLLWYRLACFLPDALPASSVAGLYDSDAIAANIDYRFVIESLGSCRRSPLP